MTFGPRTKKTVPHGGAFRGRGSKKGVEEGEKTFSTFNIMG